MSTRHTGSAWLHVEAQNLDNLIYVDSQNNFNAAVLLTIKSGVAASRVGARKR